MKIIIMSDNHGKDCLDDLLLKHADCDLFLHCGDSEMPSENLSKFIAVKGNTDFNDLKYNEIISVLNHKILLTHGHRDSFEGFIHTAQKESCDILFFGHYHRFFESNINGVYCINPGSLSYNRDYTNPSYAEMIIDETGIKVIRHDLK